MKKRKPSSNIFKSAQSTWKRYYSAPSLNILKKRLEGLAELQRKPYFQAVGLYVDSCLAELEQQFKREYRAKECIKCALSILDNEEDRAEMEKYIEARMTPFKGINI